MRIHFLATLVAVIGISTVANAELNTLQYVSHDSLGQGRLDIDGVRGNVIDTDNGPLSVDLSGANTYTLLDGEGGDMWNGGDRFTYLYDGNRVTGDFTATVRVVAQTESVNGRWGKAGITAQANLSGLGQQASAQVYSGTGSQQKPPDDFTGHNPVPVRIGGRTNADGEGGFERPISNSAGEIINNVFPEPAAGVLNPKTNVSWIRLQYEEDSNTFLAGFALDEDGTPGEWGYSDPVTDVPVPSEAGGPGWFLGLAYSAQNSFDLSEVEDPDKLHGITFDSYSIVSEYLPLGANPIGGGGMGGGSSDPTAVPEPAAILIWLALLAVAGLGKLRFCRKN